MMMADYVAMFKELSRYFPYYQNEDGERSKCVKFSNSLYPKIKYIPIQSVGGSSGGDDSSGPPYWLKCKVGHYAS
ncbi:hypothetical protein CR513_30181, partial [Mucuna pruriens]